MKANTYLHFNGNCEEAINFYADILGGEVQHKMYFKDAPEADLQFPDSVMDLIMHCTLNAGEIQIHASDYLNEVPFKQGNNFALSLNFDDEDEALTIFNGLSDGGTIMMPFEEAFWGGKFGMLLDKFDIQWMLSLNDESHTS